MFNLLDFLGQLTKRISTDFTYQFREKGKAMSPGALLKRTKGSCRDYSNLCIEICRRMGVAARFVSGYFHGGPEQDHHLHGWVEVFIPGAGWRGLDPTQGVWTDNNYIALAASADLDNIAPVSGSLRGYAKSKISTYDSLCSAA